MTDDIVSLSVRIDAASADQAAKSLDNLTAAGARAETQTGKLKAAQAALLDTQKAGGAITSKMIQDAGGWDAAQRLMTRGLEDTAAAATGAHQKITILGQALDAYTIREVAVSGREILSGNFTRLAGTASILAARTGFLSTILSATGLTIIGTAAAFGAATLAAIHYSDQMAALANISQGVGAKVGLTVSGLEAAAIAGAKAASVSVGTAQQQAQAYATTGQIGQQVIGGLIGITEDYAKLTGTKTPEAVKALAGAFADPAKGAEELNAKFGFLNATQLQHIETMTKSGDSLAAQKALYDALQPVMANTEAHLRDQTDLWHSLARGIGDALTNLGKFLSGEGQQNRLSQLQNAIKEIQLQGQGSGGVSPTGANLIKAYQAEIDTITKSAQQANVAVQNIAINKGQDVANQYDLNGSVGLLGLQQQLATVEKALTAARTGDKAAVAGLAETQEALTRAVQTYAAPAQKAHDIAVAQAEAAKATTPAQKAAAAAAMVRAHAEGEVATASQISQRAQDAATTATDKATRSLDKHAETLARQEQSIIVDTNASIAAADAYLKSSAAGSQAEAARKALTQATREGLTSAQAAIKVQSDQNLAVATEAEAVAKQARTLTDQTSIRTKYNDLVAAGALTSNQASEAIKLENDLYAKQQLLLSATGAARDALARAIAADTVALKGEQSANDNSAILAATQSMTDQLELLKQEIALANVDARTREVLLAQDKERIDLVEKYGAAAVKARADLQALIGQAGQTAGARFDIGIDTDSLVKERDAYVTYLDTLVAQTNDAANAIAGLWGNAGRGFATFMTEGINLTRQQVEIQTQLIASYKAAGAAANGSGGDQIRVQSAQAQAAAQNANAQVGYYGDIAGAAASFFDRNSTAYKALTAIETVYRAVQLAGSLQAIAAHAAETASAVGSAGTQASAWGMAAFAHTLASLPFPFNLAAGAAVLAALGAVGVKVFGHGGGTVNGNLAADTQKAVGTGSVGLLGAQSDSITKSLQTAAQDLNTMLQFQSPMLQALRSIDTNISSLTASLARQLGAANGSFDTSGLDLGTKSSHPALGFLLGGLGGLLLNSSTSKTLVDQGISFTPQQLSQLLSNVQDQAYQTVETKSKTSFLGITLASSDKTSTATGAVSDDLNKQIQLVVGSLRDGIVAAATVLGVDGAKATLDAFKVDLGKLSFKDLTTQQIQDELNAAFSKLGDQMALAVDPAVTLFQKAGEGPMDTLVRLANETQVTSQVFDQLGIGLTQTGVAGLKTRDDLIQMAGGLSAFASAGNAYVQDILTPAEQLAPIAKAVGDQLAALGLSGTATKEQFRQLVASIDLTVAGGEQLYTTLLAMAPAFAKVADAADQLANQRLDLLITLLQATGDAAGAAALQQQKDLAALDASLRPIQEAIDAAQGLGTAATDAASKVQSATQDLTAAYQAQSTALQDTISKFNGFVDSLKQFRQSLTQGSGSGLSLQQQYDQARAQFLATSKAAKGGDQAALANLQGVSQAFLTSSLAIAPNATAYQGDVSAVKNAVDAASAGAQKQVDVATRQLAALNAQVVGLIQVNSSVLSVADAVKNLHAALSAQAAAQAALNAAQAAAQSTVAASAPLSGPSTPTGLVLHDASGKALTFAVGDPSSASYYSPTEQAAKRAAALAGSYDNDNAFWGRFFSNNSDLEARYASLISSGATGGPIDTYHTAGDSNWQWVRDLYKQGMWQDRALFASGAAFIGQGVYSRPTSFGLGQMAESGPEGVLPLTNVGGRLGVYAQNDNGTAAAIRELKAEVMALRASLDSIEKSAGQTADNTTFTRKFGTYSRGAQIGDPVSTKVA